MAANIGKTAKKAERAERPPGHDGEPAASPRDWARLRRLLPLVLIPWLVVVVIGYVLAMRSPGPGLPGPIDWALTPLSANAFSACRAESEPTPVAPNPPAKASGLFVRQALAQEAPANNPPEQQQLQPQPEQQVQQQQTQQQQLPQDSGSTGGGFSGPFDIAPMVGCDELGFGDLADVAMDVTGQRAWAVNRYGLLYDSDDGGRSWARQAVPDIPDRFVFSAIAVDDDGEQLVLAGRNDRYEYAFWRSADGGRNWVPVQAMRLVGGENAGPVYADVAGLAIGATSSGLYVVAALIGDTQAAIPGIWRDSTGRWSIGYEELDAEMIHRLRSHDFGLGFVDLGATGPAAPPIASWDRWQDDSALRYSLLTRDPNSKEAALTGDNTPVVEFMVDATGLHAVAASDDGREVFAVETHAILRGNAEDRPWSRIGLAPVAGHDDYALAAIDVANGAEAIMAVGRNALFVSQDGGASFFQPALSRYPAPWFYLLLLSGPLFAFRLMRPGPPETRIVDADETRALSDRALSLKDPDALNLRAYAEGLADLLRNTETRPPLVIGVTGPWGSGKSSVMQMLSELLSARQMPVVWFNAWHHQSEEHLLASLLSNIRRQGIPGMFTRPGLRLRWRLTLQKLKPHEPVGSFLWSWFLLLAGIALLSGAAALWLNATPTLPKVAAGEADLVTDIQGLLCSDDACKDLVAALSKYLVGLKLGAVLTFLLGLVPLSRLKQVALATRNFDPAKLMSSMMPASRNPRLDEQLSFRHGFGEELRATIGALAPYRLVIFIDDLDRCRPENVAAVLEAVNFVVSAADCYVVLGMDRAYVLRAIRQEFEKFIAMEREERKDPALGSPEEDKGRPRDFAEHYLEKLVNLIVSVPKMTPEARGRLMETLASKPPQAEAAAPRFDWGRWGRRSAAVAAILAALLGPALYVATLAPAEIDRRAVEQPLGGQTVGSAEQGAAEGAPQGKDIRTVTPEIAEVAALGASASAVFGRVGPILLGLCGLAALAGIAWAAMRAISVPPNLLVRDSKAFKTTLRSVEADLGSFMTTPRRAKRFVNRLRMFGAMLRSGRPDLEGAREAALDRATVQAGALHALARELWLARQSGGSAPADATERAAWEKTRKLVEDSVGVYRQALVSLYHAIDRPMRPMVDALYWRFWQVSDGATLGDPAIVQLAEQAAAPGGAGEMLRPDAADALDALIEPAAGSQSSPEVPPA